MDADDLYGLPLERFVPARTALAKERRAGGDRDGAADVTALRKPTVAAWAVNQLVRTQRKAVKALFDAGDALRKAQDKLLAGRGGDARSLRAAAARERAAVEALVEKARGLLSAEGEDLSSAVLERVSETLHAAALDEDARAAVRDGTLLRELRHAGLGFGDATVVAGPPASPRAKRAPAAGGARSGSPAAARKAAKQEAERAAAVAAEREAARKAARSAEVAARRRAEKAARALEAAEQRRARAAQALEEADAQLEAAREEAAAAVAEHEQAQARLD